MGEDASLDDFLTTSEREESDDTETESAAQEAESDETAPEAETEQRGRATTTYAWDGAGAACDACGEAVERRWQQDGGLVCASCKDWDRA